jgi:hypothetical protein
LNNPKYENFNSSEPVPAFKKLSYVSEENKKQLSNYMDPIAQFNSHRTNKEYLKSPILFNSGTYSLQKEKIFNKINDINDIPEKNLKISVRFKITLI